MNSKSVALFLSLGLTATLAACGRPVPAGGEEGGQQPGSQGPSNPDEMYASVTSQQASSSPIMLLAEGGEGGEGCERGERGRCRGYGEYGEG